MFLEKNSEDDFFNEVEEKLATEHNKENYYTKKINHTVELLMSGAHNLKRAGLVKEAEVVVMMAKDLCEDPAVKVSPEDMVNNLENEGWGFPPAKDLGLIDDSEEDLTTMHDKKEIRNQALPDLHEF